MLIPCENNIIIFFLIEYYQIFACIGCKVSVSREDSERLLTRTLAAEKDSRYDSEELDSREGMQRRGTQAKNWPLFSCSMQGSSW